MTVNHWVRGSSPRRGANSKVRGIVGGPVILTAKASNVTGLEPSFSGVFGWKHLTVIRGHSLTPAQFYCRLSSMVEPWFVAPVTVVRFY